MADKSLLERYLELKEEHPAAYTVAAIAPVTGQALALADYADAMNRGDTGDGIAAVASLIPGIKLAKFGGKLAPAAYELAASQAFAPRSARAVLAPATANADRIGKAAAAEQVAQYVAPLAGDIPVPSMSRADTQKIPPRMARLLAEKQAAEAEYSKAWNEQ